MPKMTSDATNQIFGDAGFPELPEVQKLTLETGVPVTAAATVGDAVAAAFGDGTIRFFWPNDPPIVVCAHRGAVLCLEADGDAALSGGDDGRFLRTSPDGSVEEIASFGTRWVDCVAASNRMYACSSSRVAHV